jgi:hypothetical protein
VKVRKKFFPVGFQRASPLVDMNKQDMFRYPCIIDSKVGCRLNVYSFTMD